MEQVKRVLDGSLLWRFLNALCLWFGRQWSESAVVGWFLHPAPWESAASERSVLFRLWQRLRGGLCLLYEKLRLERLFAGSVFLNTWLWCALAGALAPLAPTMAALALVLAAYASLALELIRRREQPLRYAPMNKYLLLYAGVYLAAIAMSVTPSAGLQPGLLLICFALFALVVQNAVTTRRQAELFTCILVLSAAAVSVVGIFQYFFDEYFFDVSGAAAWVDEDMFSYITVRVYSTLQNPNMLAQYLVLMLPLGGALLLTARDWGRRILWFACCGLITLCLLLTLSRGGWLGALIAGAIFALLLSPRLILLIPVALVALWFLLPDTIISRFTSIGNLKDSSTSYRVSIWMGSLAMLRDYWLCGIGPGTEAFNLIYPAYSYNAASAQHTHNLLLQLVSDGGVCALALFLLIIFAFCRQLCVALSKNKDKHTRLFLIAFLSAAMGFLAQGMTDYSFYNYRVALMFWIVLGLGAVWARLAVEEVGRP